MNTCALCGGNLKEYEEDMEGVNVKGWKCQKCSETFFLQVKCYTMRY